MPGLYVTGSAELPEGALEALDFALIINFLALGEFQRFEDLFHFIERMFEFLDDAVHLLDSITNGRSLMMHWLWLLLMMMLMLLMTWLRFFDCWLGRFNGCGRDWFTRRRQGCPRFTTSGMTAATASGTARASGGGCWWRGSALFCFVRRHGYRLPTGN